MEFSPFGLDLFGNPISSNLGGSLAKRFTAPPLTLLDARKGAWQERKRAWFSLGIQSEVGRGNVRPSVYQTNGPVPKYSSKDSYGGGDLWTARSTGGGEERQKKTGASIFDPVLSELAYRWFCPPGGQVVDPFAGGSVRGIVASHLGLSYWGCDLRPEQVASNVDQGASILDEGSPKPQWVCADAREALASAPRSDFLFTCPPYGNLEVYSQDPRDLSTMSWDDFCVNYQEIIKKGVNILRDDRFAAIVVGEVRDPKNGCYRGLVPLTINAFKDAGALYYNEGLFVTPSGTVPIRAGRQFVVGRKLAKVHQVLLVFLKGNWQRAVQACGPLERLEGESNGENGERG